MGTARPDRRAAHRACPTASAELEDNGSGAAVAVCGHRPRHAVPFPADPEQRDKQIRDWLHIFETLAGRRGHQAGPSGAWT